MATKIEAWRTADGKVFADKALAELHEADIEVTTGVEKLVRSELGGEIYKDDVVNFILNNWSALYALLDKKMKTNAPYTL